MPTGGKKRNKSRIHMIRGVKIMLDADLAQIFGMAKGEKLYHCGASSKDAGNKITTIVQLEHIEGYRPMFEELWAQLKKMATHNWMDSYLKKD